MKRLYSSAAPCSPRKVAPAWVLRNVKQKVSKDLKVWSIKLFTTDREGLMKYAVVLHYGNSKVDHF